jgi:hypothetical protein
MPGSRADEDELHEYFATTRLRREWFEPSFELTNIIDIVSSAILRLGTAAGAKASRETMNIKQLDNSITDELQAAIHTESPP